MSKKPPKDTGKKVPFPGAAKGKAKRTKEDLPDGETIMPAAEALNPRQRAFCEHYIKTSNGTESARLAGYSGSENTLATTGHDLLRNPKVSAYLKELQARVSSKRILSAEQRLEILSEIVTGKAEGEGVFFGEPVVTKPTFGDRIRASELMSKMKGELTEKKQVEGEVVIRVVRGNHAPSAIGTKESDE